VNLDETAVRLVYSKKHLHRFQLDLEIQACAFVSVETALMAQLRGSKRAAPPPLPSPTGLGKTNQH
jgi:hypothetical protein